MAPLSPLAAAVAAQDLRRVATLLCGLTSALPADVNAALPAANVSRLLSSHERSCAAKEAFVVGDLPGALREYEAARRLWEVPGLGLSDAELSGDANSDPFRVKAAQLNSNIAAVQLKIGKPYLAKHFSDRAVLLHPGWAKAWYRQGVVLNEIGDYAKAVASLRKRFDAMPAAPAPCEPFRSPPCAVVLTFVISEEDGESPRRAHDALPPPDARLTRACSRGHARAQAWR